MEDPTLTPRPSRPKEEVESEHQEAQKEQPPIPKELWDILTDEQKEKFQSYEDPTTKAAKELEEEIQAKRDAHMKAREEENTRWKDLQDRAEAAQDSGDDKLIEKTSKEVMDSFSDAFL